MSKYIMKRTKILCPECLKGKLIHEKDNDLYCDRCGTKFIYTDKETQTFGYKNTNL